MTTRQQLTVEEINGMECPWCYSQYLLLDALKQRNILQAREERPGWVVGHCYKCNYDFSSNKLLEDLARRLEDKDLNH